MNRGQSFSSGGPSKSTADYASQNLGIHEDLMGNVFVKDLAVIPVSTPEVRPATEHALQLKACAMSAVD